MRVGGVEAVQQDFLDVVAIVAVRVLQEHHVGRLREDDAVLIEFEPGGVVQVARKHRPLVGLAVAIGVFEDEQRVVHRRLGLPMRVILPGRYPESAPRVERHLHGIDQLGKFLLRREQLDLQPLADGHFLNRFIAGHKHVFAVRALAGFVGQGVYERRRVGIEDLEVGAFWIGTARERPDAPLTVGRHHVEHRDLALKHLVIGRQHVFLGELHLTRIHVARVAPDEREERAVSVRRIAVGRAVAVEPVEILVDHGLTQGRQIGVPLPGGGAKQRAIDDLADPPVAVGAQMHAVDGQRRFRRGVQLAAGRKQVHEAHAPGLRHLPHGLRVDLQALVVLPAVRQVRIAEVFMRNRREEDDSRRRLAVVLLGERLREPVAQLLPERGEPSVPRVRFVVAEKRKDDVRLRIGSGEPVVRVAADRRRLSGQPLVGRAEVLRAQPGGDLVAAEAKIANHEVVLREARVQQRLEPAVVLHPLGQRVADEADVIARAQDERIGGFPVHG